MRKHYCLTLHSFWFGGFLHWKSFLTQPQKDLHLLPGSNQTTFTYPSDHYSCVHQSLISQAQNKYKYFFSLKTFIACEGACFMRMSNELKCVQGKCTFLIELIRVIIVICWYSWGRGEGRFNPEKNKGPGEDLHHNPWGHLQFWLHRSVSLLLCYGRPGKMAGSFFIHFGLSSSIYSIYIVMHYFSPRDLLVWCISHQTKEILSVKHSCLLHPLSRWEKISTIISVECVSNNI